MIEEQTDKLERFPPVMLYSILAAVRRFEPDFYTHLCRRYHFDADRIMGLFSEVEMLGPGQLTAVLKDLREHNSYHDIMMLAGKNALVEFIKLNDMKLQTTTEGKFRSTLVDLLPVFTGKARFNLLQRGDVHFLEIWNSVFVRNNCDGRAVCGFYEGLISELGSGQAAGSCAVQEVRCQAVDPEIDCCQFQISLL